MRIDKSITIPQFTEIDVEIDTDEILEDMDMDSIVDYVVENYGNKQVLRYMQHNHDFSEDDIEEAVGRKFVNGETEYSCDVIGQLIESGDIDSQELIGNIPDEDMKEYRKGLVLHMSEIVEYINKADSTARLIILKHILKETV